MSFSCLRPLASNISVDVLYIDNIDNTNLYSKNGTLPLCSSTSPPQPSDCVVCLFNRFSYAVCDNLLKNQTLVMEGAGQNIDISKSECPVLLGDANDIYSSAIHGDARLRWLILIPILLFILFVLLVVLKLWKCGKTPKYLKGWKNGVVSREMNTITQNAV